MSTRSCIMIKVRANDLATTKLFDPNKLPVPQQSWDESYEKSTAEMAEPVEIKELYLGIYCHSDGYPDGVGKVLKETFNDYDLALNLILGGHCSVVWYDMVRRYANRYGEEWQYLYPKQGESPEYVYSHIDSQYCYLFDEEKGGWLLNDYSDDDTFIVEGDEQTRVPKPTFVEF